MLPDHGQRAGYRLFNAVPPVYKYQGRHRKSPASSGNVGIKVANLVLGIACGQPRIAVDIHVHHVTNRWGYIALEMCQQVGVTKHR